MDFWLDFPAAALDAKGQQPILEFVLQEGGHAFVTLVMQNTQKALLEATQSMDEAELKRGLEDTVA